ncbi:MAG: hypothetical protein Aurels2KO_28760 [Aureliella sp.]
MLLLKCRFSVLLYVQLRVVREMSEKSSTSCPECNLVLRFSASNSGTVALKCPGCGNLFETQVQVSDTSKPVVAAAKVVQAKVISGPSKQAASPAPSQNEATADDEIFEAELVEEELLEGVLIEESEPAADNEPVAPLRPKLKKPQGKKKASRPQPAGNAKSNQSSAGRKKWVLPAAIAGSAASLAGVAFLVNGLFSSGPGTTGQAVQSAERLNEVVEQYVQTLESVTDGESRPPAAEKLRDLESQFTAIAFDALSCGEVEGDTQAVAIRSLLTEGAPLRAEVSSQSRRINSNYPLDDELYTVDQRLKSLVHAIEQHLNYSLTALTVADSPVQRTCASSIAIKRRIVATIAKLNDGADPISTVEQLYRMSDELNQLAEEHSKTGRRISVMAHEYESANRASDAMRQWLVEYVKETLSPEPELQYTLEEVEATARRLELALQAGVSRLATTTKQRVDARLFAMNIVPRAQEAPTIQTPVSPSSIASAPRVQPRLQPESEPAPSSGNIASASQPTRPAPTASSSAPSALNTVSSNSTAADVAETPASPNSQSSIASHSADGSVEYSPDQQPTARYTGKRSIQIKVVGAAKEDLETDFRSLVSMLGVPASDISGSGRRVTMSFPYSGSMYKVAKMVGFGEVQCCDIQSRTLFVAAQ